MSNAIKFTRKGQILITGNVTPKVDDPDMLVLTVSVTDEGIGMSEENLARVFNGEMLENNIMSQSLNPYSNGIGLLFCKQVCQSLDGNISAVSVLG